MGGSCTLVTLCRTGDLVPHNIYIIKYASVQPLGVKLKNFFVKKLPQKLLPSDKNNYYIELYDITVLFVWGLKSFDSGCNTQTGRVKFILFLFYFRKI
jgi:hypothetical protein